MKLKAHRSATYLALLNRFLIFIFIPEKRTQGLQIAKQNFFYERKIAGEKKNLEEPDFTKKEMFKTYHYIIREIWLMKQELPDFKITTKLQKSEYSNDIE